MLLCKYLQPTKFIKNPTTDAERKRYLAVVGLFEKHAGNHGSIR